MIQQQLQLPVLVVGRYRFLAKGPCRNQYYYYQRRTTSTSNNTVQLFYNNNNKRSSNNNNYGIINHYNNSNIVSIIHRRYMMIGSSRRTSTTATTTITTTTTSSNAVVTTATSSNRKRILTIVGSIGVITISSVSLWYTHYYFDGVEGIQRAISFYSLAIPKYILYRYHQYKQSSQYIWDQLDQETSQQGLQIILQLKGFYIKCGQMCAANIGNAFPVIWQETMSILQDQVPYEDYETVILPIIQQELPNYKDIFTYIHPIPIGSASIGQVHRAKMIVHDSTNNNNNNNTSTTTQSPIKTKDVVIKICYPHVERLLRGDVRTIRTFCEIAQPVHVPAMKEVEKQFVTEFDYVQEANNLYKVRSNLIRHQLCLDDKTSSSNNDSNLKNVICTVPYPYREYCTKRILVMDEIHGDKLVDVLKRDGEKWMKLLSNVRQSHQSKVILSTDENINNVISEQKPIVSSSSSSSSSERRITTEEYDRYLSMIDTSRRIYNIRTRIYNTFIGWWYDGSSSSTQKYPYHTKSEYVPLNPSKLVDDLLYIHAYQVLVDGRFNADCHPGNFLLCRKPDGSPYLGLIDFGQVKTLTKEQRHLFCKIIIALANEDKESVVQLMQEAGFQSKYMDPNVIYLYAKVCYDEDNKELTNGKHIQLFMEDIQSMDPIIHLPTDYIMVGRASILLRGLAHTLQQSRSVAKSWKSLAEHVLKHDL